MMLLQPSSSFLLFLLFLSFLPSTVVKGVETKKWMDEDAKDINLHHNDKRTARSAFSGHTFYQHTSWSSRKRESKRNNGWGFKKGDWDDHVWSSQGRDVFNSRRVTTSNSDKAKKSKLTLTVPSFELVINASTSATPAILGNSIIVPSWDGGLRSIHSKTGRLQWKVDIGLAYFRANRTGTVISRTTPVFSQDGSFFIIGTLKPAILLYIRSMDGLLLGKTPLDDHPWSVVTMGGTLTDDGIFIVGVSSLEELAASDPTYECCSFVGSLVAIDLKSSGSILWRQYSIGSNISGLGKFSGASYWGSSPAVWSSQQMVFVATGNNYEAPENYTTCLVVNTTSYCDQLYGVLGTDTNYNHVNAVIAYDIPTGNRVWVKQMNPRDVWNVACMGQNNPNCPPNPGPDYDFGMAPILDWWCYNVNKTNLAYPHHNNSIVMSWGGDGNTTFEGDEMRISNLNDTHVKICIRALYIGQKSGVLYALRASTGDLIWEVQACPGGTYGGINWGISIDDDKVYLPCTNANKLNWRLVNGTTVTSGGWAAHSKMTGKVVWTTANPAWFDPRGSINGRKATSMVYGPPTVLDDLLLVTSPDTNLQALTQIPLPGSGGYVYALNTTTGKILSSYETKASVYGGFSANVNCAYVGSGYQPIFGTSMGTSIYGWCGA